MKAVTRSCAETFFLTLPEEVELDTDEPQEREEVVLAFRERLQSVPQDRQLDVDVEDNVF